MAVYLAKLGPNGPGDEAMNSCFNTGNLVLGTTNTPNNAPLGSSWTPGETGMESCVHQGSPSSVPQPHSTHEHPLMAERAEQHVPGGDIPYQSVASAPTSALVEMLSRIDALEAIPRLQVGPSDMQPQYTIELYT